MRLLAHFFQDILKIMAIGLYETDASLLITVRNWDIAIHLLKSLFPMSAIASSSLFTNPVLHSGT
jgi:hypothetical protein